MNLRPILPQPLRSFGLPYLVLAVTCAALLTLATSYPVRAQSGRRAADGEPRKPAPAPSPASAVAAAPQFRLVVGGAKHDPSLTYPLDFDALVLRPCVARLQASPEVSVAEAGKLTRRQAQARAKAGADEHVVWLGLGVEASVAGGPGDVTDSTLR